MKALQHLNKYFIKYKYHLLIGIVITIASNILRLVTPRFIRKSLDVVDLYLKKEITSIAVVKTELLNNILIIIGTALLAGFFIFLMRQTLINMSRLIEFDLKNDIYGHYQKLSLHFYKKNKIGDLMNRISEDVGKVRMYLGPAIMYSINTLTLFVIALWVMFNQAPTLAMYTIIPLPILSIIIYKVSKTIHKRSTKVQEYLSKLSSFTQENFSGISVVKAYRLEPDQNQNFNTLALGSKDKQLQLSKTRALFFPMMLLLIGTSNILVIYIGGLQYINNQISLGTILEFIIYVNMLTWPVATVGWVTSIIQEAEASQKRINTFLNEEPEITNSFNTPKSIKGNIEFKNVTFTYPDTNITALKNLNFKLNKGETLGIIGKTGSGKSTVLELISRLYQVNNGTILIDNENIEHIHLESLRNAIGYVPQDAFLFSDTIANNIKFGYPEATEKDLINVAKLAQVHDNITDFSNGYNTVLGERGITLSGGQKQRVSIARALLKKPNILLLDDCLSAVDTETEERILAALKSVSNSKTTCIVSHRISSVKHANKIIVLENGSIVQQGTHQTLVNQDGYYKNLYKKQLSQKEN